MYIDPGHDPAPNYERRPVSAVNMCAKITQHMGENSLWGGSAYIHMRTPMFSIDRNGKLSRKMVVKHRTLVGKDDKPLANPFWDFQENRPKLIKCSMMQVQVGFDWQKVVRDAQEKAGVEQDFVAGAGAKTWRSETRFVTLEVGKKRHKTLFFYRVEINNATGEEKPFEPGKSKIYLACLRPMKSVIKSKVWFEEINPLEGVEPKRYIREDKIEIDGQECHFEDWLTADRDEDAIAEAQGHPDRPDLNRAMFTPKIENLVSISVFGKKYNMPKVKWDEVTPVSFIDLPITEEDDPVTRSLESLGAEIPGKDKPSRFGHDGEKKPKTKPKPGPDDPNRA